MKDMGQCREATVNPLCHGRTDPRQTTRNAGSVCRRQEPKATITLAVSSWAQGEVELGADCVS